MPFQLEFEYKSLIFLYYVETHDELVGRNGSRDELMGRNITAPGKAAS